jgi:hypothetical protein
LAIPTDAVVVHLHAIGTEAETATGTKQLSSDAPMLILSPEERAVRAGVITNIMPPSERSFSNLLFR